VIDKRLNSTIPNASLALATVEVVMNLKESGFEGTAHAFGNTVMGLIKRKEFVQAVIGAVNGNSTDRYKH
jgi:hypothetical protein